MDNLDRLDVVPTTADGFPTRPDALLEVQDLVDEGFDAGQIGAACVYGLERRMYPPLPIEIIKPIDRLLLYGRKHNAAEVVMFGNTLWTRVNSPCGAVHHILPVRGPDRATSRPVLGGFAWAGEQTADGTVLELYLGMRKTSP